MNCSRGCGALVTRCGSAGAEREGRGGRSHLGGGDKVKAALANVDVVDAVVILRGGARGRA